MDDINDIMLWAQGPRCYKYIKVIDDLNNSGSHELRPINAMNKLGIQVIWVILSHEEKALNVMNNLGLLMIVNTLGHELKALDVMNN